MKITRRQIEKLIEASVRRDGRFVTPIEEPLSDPLEDLYYDEKQKKNIKMLAMTDDEEARASAGEFAELGGFEPTDRFGADDFPKQVVAYELDIDILNDFKEVDAVIKDACMNWMYQHVDEITAYDNVQIRPYEDYVKTVVEEPKDVDSIMLLTIQIIADEIDHLSQQDEPNRQLIERFKKAKKLFESNHEAARSHVYDILTLHPHMLYKIYFDTNSEIESIGVDFEDPRKKYAGSYPPHGATDKERYDMRMATFKEGKIKITRRQLRELIAEAVNEKREPKEYTVKTVPEDQYAVNVDKLPPPMQAVADGPEPTAEATVRYTKGNFFATRGVDYEPASGYKALRNFFDIYMILPDGEAILVNPSSFVIDKAGDAQRFLSLLDQHVTVLPLDSLKNADAMSNQVKAVMSMMREE